MKTRKVIQMPDGRTVAECIKFWNNAGYKRDINFKIDYNPVDVDFIIVPITQMILAQDAIAFGFKIVEI